MIDILNQINREQAWKTLKFSLIAGLGAALAVAQTDLPKIIDTTTPLGVFVLTAVMLASKFLNSGKPVP